MIGHYTKGIRTRETCKRHGVVNISTQTLVCIHLTCPLSNSVKERRALMHCFLNLSLNPQSWELWEQAVLWLLNLQLKYHTTLTLLK